MLKIESIRHGMDRIDLQVGRHKLIFNHITTPDIPAHNHPYGFESTVLRDPYVDEIWVPQSDGGVIIYEFIREPGFSHVIPAGTIHRIRHLPTGETVTSIRWFDWEPRQEVMLYRIENGKLISKSESEGPF